ncbi:hypothetical protein NA56DRAFT_349943 [Hyaloscypha hepaticicola]|uniref:Uncharacterized protein n=1 Tax=Hyaloscypha hepaticicola TaxID=2082293 RepID=A0A2J6PMM4_9HELO|nr:hypothetical protein NA56DRAFT_349943 [Hyaloscypha hepaticicola]
MSLALMYMAPPVILRNTEQRWRCSRETQGWKEQTFRWGNRRDLAFPLTSKALQVFHQLRREGSRTDRHIADNDNTRVFNGGENFHRAGLNLVNGVVFAGFGGHCDQYNYTGWVVGVSTAGRLETAYATSGGANAPLEDATFNGGGGGCAVWMGGSAIASDQSGRIFFATGNGQKKDDSQNTPASGRILLDTLSEAVVNMGVNTTTGKLFQQDYFETYQLVASTSSGSAGAVGILQAILQAMLQEAGPVGYCLNVLKGIISAGCCARCLLGVLFLGVLFLDPRSLVLYLLLVGRFIPRSWILYLLLARRFVPGSSFRSWHCWLLGIAGSWALRVHGRCWLLALRVRGHCGFLGVAGSWALLARRRCSSWKPWEP